MAQRNTREATAGRWPEILVAIGGITADQLCTKEGPCPSCAVLSGDPGSTRFRWDDDTGDGSWFCSHCGGTDGAGGGGNGLDLLSRLRLRTWGPSAMVPTLQLVEKEFLRVSTTSRGRRSKAASPRPAPKKRAATPSRSEWLAFCRLEAADQTADDEAFRPSAAEGGAYQRRWVRWCETADPDLVEAATLEGDTVAGSRLAPDLEPPPAPEAPSGPLTLEQVRQRLTQAVADGTSRADREALLLGLAEAGESTPANLRALLRSLEQEHEAAEAVADEERQFLIATDRAEIGQRLITLDTLFPPSVAGAVRQQVEYLPSDEVTCAGVLLAAASSMLRLGTELVASRLCDFRAPLNLYAALVGRSGSKKGPVWKKLSTKPLAPIEEELRRRHNQAMEAWRMECQGKKPFEKPDPPRPVRLAIQEYTGEGLALQFQRQEEDGAPLILLRDEILGLFSGFGKYSGGRGDDEQRILEMYDGGGFSSLRVGVDGGARSFSRCHFSILGTIQPETLSKLVSGGDPGGIWARFLFMPMSNKIVGLPLSETEEDALATELAERVLCETFQALYRLPRISLELEQSARTAFVKYELRCQHDSATAPVAAQGAAWSKAPGKVLRIAGLLHLIHRVCPDGAVGDLVGEEMIQAAANLVDHLTGWSLGIHQAAMDGGGASDLMRKVHQVAQASAAPIGWAEILRSLGKRARAEVDSSAAVAAVGALVRLGVGEQGEGRRPGSWTYRATSDLPS
jgi:hypothetical protein